MGDLCLLLSPPHRRSSSPVADPHGLTQQQVTHAAAGPGRAFALSAPRPLPVCHAHPHRPALPRLLRHAHCGDAAKLPAHPPLLPQRATSRVLSSSQHLRVACSRGLFALIMKRLPPSGSAPTGWVAGCVLMQALGELSEAARWFGAWWVVVQVSRGDGARSASSLGGRPGDFQHAQKLHSADLAPLGTRLARKSPSHTKGVTRFSEMRRRAWQQAGRRRATPARSRDPQAGASNESGRIHAL